MDANWNKERQKLKDEIFKEIRQQKDRSGKVTIMGTAKINPAYLTAGAAYVYGPFAFETKFLRAPNITFGQVALDRKRPVYAVPQIDRWVTSLGTVEGFYLRVYAFQQPPSGLAKHFITWQATGKASAYHTESKQESWRMGYNFDKAHHLHGD